MDDHISRQAAIDLFPNDVLEWDTLDGYIAPHVARQLIEDLPTVDVIPIEWIEEWCLSQNLTYIRLAVEKLLGDWRKENDTLH